MRRGYVRLTKSGVSRKAQEDALRQAGIDDFSEYGPVYVESVRKSGADTGERRAAAVRSLLEGDELVIATPGCLAGTRADVLSALAAISARGAALHIVSTGATVRWSAEAAAAAEFAAQAESECAAMRARHARQSRGDKLGGRKPKLVKGMKTFDRVEAVWRDPAKSAAEVAAETGYSVATLYRAFGAKGTPLFGGNNGRKPKKSN